MDQEITISAMSSICYIVPYFGKLPKSFQMWLLSCGKNLSVNWIVFTDDHREYAYPVNVKVRYCSFEDIRERISKIYDFPINLDRPYKLCDFKPAYGEIFAEELAGYEFWGHCDVDVIWGNIRKFLTEDILQKYDKIGDQGHSTLYRNTSEVNARYRTEMPGVLNYKQVFTDQRGYCFDENGMSEIYNRLGIAFFHECNYAHLAFAKTSFFLAHLPSEWDYKNRRQLFLWINGNLYRYYAHNGKLLNDEWMYVHTFIRPIAYKADFYDVSEAYELYPDCLKRIKREKVTYSHVKRKGYSSAIRYFCALAYERRKKISLKKAVWYLKKMMSRG